MNTKTLRLAACLLAGAAVVGMAGLAAAQPIYKPSPGQDLNGVWLIDGDYSTLKTTEGKTPPLTKAAKAVYDAHLKARKAGNPAFDTIQTCKPHGFPRILTARYPIEILQEPKQVTFIHEVHHFPRMVYLDMAPPKVADLDPNWMGVSAGHWEGDVLVVNSGGVYDKTTLDAAGLPHTTALEVTEHIRKIDASTLEDVLTFNDPASYAKPWSTRLTFKKQPADARLKEYVCTDANPEAVKPTVATK